MVRKLAQLGMVLGLAGAGLCAGCGYSPRAEFRQIRSASVSSQAGSGAVIGTTTSLSRRPTDADLVLARRND